MDVDGEAEREDVVKNREQLFNKTFKITSQCFVHLCYFPLRLYRLALLIIANMFARKSPAHH